MPALTAVTALPPTCSECNQVHWGGVVTAMMSKLTSQLQEQFCKLAEICKTEKLLSAVAFSVNQEINKTGTLSHGIPGFAVLQQLEMRKTGTLPCDISGVVVFVDQHITKNFLIHA